MIRGTLAFVLLVLLALLGTGARRWLARHRGIPGLQSFGTVLAGAALGSAGLGLFPDGVLTVLRPVILLGLTWIGLLIGLQFDLKVLRRLKPWQRWPGFLIPLAAGGITGGVALAAGQDRQVALLLAAVAATASPRLIVHLSRSGPPADRTAMRLLLTVSSLSSAPAVVLYGVGSVLLAPRGGPFGPAASLVVGLGLAAVLGWATILLLRGEREEIHVLALLVGVMALTAGVAMLTGAEPMLAAAVTGAVVANRSRFPHRILRAAHAIEIPMLTALLLLLGAWWRPSAPSLAVVVLLVGVRDGGLLLGGRVLERLAAAHGAPVTARPMGAGLLPPGPLPLAFLVASAQAGHCTPGLAGGIFAALAVNHLAGGLWTRRHLFGVLQIPREADP